MKEVKFQDDNRTLVIATGFASDNEATSAIDTFLEEQGDEYGRFAEGFEENGVFYYRVVTAESYS